MAECIKLSFYLLSLDGDVGSIKKFLNLLGDYKLHVWVFSDWRRKQIHDMLVHVKRYIYLMHTCTY